MNYKNNRVKEYAGRLISSAQAASARRVASKAVMAVRRIIRQLPARVISAKPDMRTLGADCVKAGKVTLSGFLLFIKHISRLRKATVIWLSGSATGFAVITVVALMIVNAHAVGVSISGQRVGYVSDEETFATLVNNVKAELSAANENTVIIIDESKIDLADSSTSGKKETIEFIDTEDLKATLLASNAIMASAYAISVNGTQYANIATQKDAEGLLTAIVEKFTGGNPAVSYQWGDDVQIVNVSSELQSLTSTSSAMNYLLTGDQQVEYYTVQKGDTLWDIAQTTGVSLDEIAAANPEINIDSIHVGDQIAMSKLVAFIHLQTTETAITVEDVPFETIEEKTDSLFIGQTQIKIAGVNGTREVTREITKVNGDVTNAVEVNSVPLTDSQPQTVLIGTKAKPRAVSYAPSGGSYVGGNGVLSNPMSRMEASSGWGGGRNHKGIDFRNPLGTPIYAAAEGTVTYAAWYAGYGNLVRISHGNGMETWYAHCSVLNVQAGQSVSRGQQIAQVGATGNASGYHLHFEVRINGTPVNPMGYL